MAAIQWLFDKNLAAREHVRELRERYNEPHRAWHTTKHIDRVLDYLCVLPEIQEIKRMDRQAFDALLLAVAYHDAVYDPTRNDNELMSAELLKQHQGDEDEVVKLAVTLILETNPDVKPTNRLSELLREADTEILSSPLPEMLAYGRAIYREYQRYDYTPFVGAHLAVLRGIYKETRHGKSSNFDAYEAVLRAARLRVGIYAGSFNPWHAGHTDVVMQALRMFDKVVIARGNNPEKNVVISDFFTSSCGIKGAPTHLETISFTGPLWKLYEHYNNHPNYDVAIIRGLRNVNDLASEVTQRQFVQDFGGKIPYAFIVADPALAHISSSAIRSLDALGADTTRYL